MRESITTIGTVGAPCGGATFAVARLISYVRTSVVAHTIHAFVVEIALAVLTVVPRHLGFVNVCSFELWVLGWS